MKIYILILLSIVHLFGIELTVKQSDIPVTVSKEEIAFLKAIFIKRNIRIKTNEAEKLIKENRILSDYYLKTTHELNKDMVNIKLEIEKNLASEIIRKIQSKIGIDDETVKSYYIANKYKFVQSKMVDVEIYKFDTYEDALKFYEKFKDNLKEINTYAKEQKIDVFNKKVRFSNLNRNTQDYIEQYKIKKSALIVPMFFSPHYSVIHIKDIEEKGIQKYDAQLKNKIKRELFKRTFEKDKDALIKKLQSKS